VERALALRPTPASFTSLAIPVATGKYTPVVEPEPMVINSWAIPRPSKAIAANNTLFARITLHLLDALVSIPIPPDGHKP